MDDEQAYMQTALYKIQETPGYSPLPEEGSVNTLERQVQNVAEPATFKPTDEQFWMNDQRGRRRPNTEFLREHFLKEGRVDGRAGAVDHQASYGFVSFRAKYSLCPQPGHRGGGYSWAYDLMKILEIGGKFSDTNYLFLGDYVDRGCFGIECLLYLYSLKLWWPDRLFLLRGNHECRHLTEYFTFRRECLHKYSNEVYEACIESFSALPVVGLLDGKFFCVHGGISPHLDTLEDIHRMNRFEEPQAHGLLCDLLWADPIPNYGHENEPSMHGPGIPKGTLWEYNGVRGCSYEAVVKFLQRNDLYGVIRAHEAQDAGYTMFRKTPTKKFPSVITVFSAPNYLDVYHNRGAIVKYANRNFTIRQYHARSHPYWLPNFMDAFTWSLPFVGAKIIEMLLAILSICSQEELEVSSDEETDDGRTVPDAEAAITPSELSARRQQIKNKILVVGKMQRIFQLLREESEWASELAPAVEQLPGAGARGGDALGVQGNQIRQYIRSFDEARRLDQANERLPQFDYTPTSYPLVSVPSMRQPLLQRSYTSGGSTPTGEGEEEAGPPGAWPHPPGMDTEALIHRTLAEDDGDGGVVERLAERIARGRKPTGRPRPLKRHETT
ncbi:hypothetical protein EW146_g2790 [Bondarzewia mesenterica]|uniref:Serine/threonine-protein phosphatase n=1 Tax=Bondarzewia mesenterica TaxID=1095465 RepID=A0A4S4M035_9AGAM|nr:hypothetical protein EW146_g2790 [Bondarzewia mesenterica]